MTTDDRTPDDEAILRFAREHLGADSAEHLSQAAVLASVRARIREGIPLSDAVLKEIHGQIGADPLLENEFANYVLPIAMSIGHSTLPQYARLKRYLNTGDLADSVLGNLWPDMSELEFISEDKFASLLAMRMNNKARDHARMLDTQKRAERRRSPEQPDELAHQLPDRDDEADPAARAVQREERQLVARILINLSETERTVLKLALTNLDRQAIADQLGMTYDGVRMALRRAMIHARELNRWTDDTSPEAPPA